MGTSSDRNNQFSGGRSLTHGLWWLGHLLLTSIAGFFVWFGVSLLLASYGLKDPFSFIMTFFASNLNILNSLVMIHGCGLRKRRLSRQPSRDPDP